MSAQYETIYEKFNVTWIAKPNNGGELHPGDVVDELNSLLRQVEAAKASVQLVRSPLMGEIERLRDALEERESRIAELEARIDRLEGAE